MEILSKTRIDKWLWAVRVFKTRSLASEACQSGKVKINDKTAKSSSLIQIDYTVTINKGAGEKIIYVVKKIIEKRVSASLAAECFVDNSPPKEVDGIPSAFLNFEKRDKGVGRPTKRDRRNIDKFKKD